MSVYYRLFIVLFVLLITNKVNGQYTPQELLGGLGLGDIRADTLIVQNIDSVLSVIEGPYEEELLLVMASSVGFIEVCKTLIHRGAEVDYMLGGTSSLMIASFRGQEEIVKLLLVNGATVNLQAKEGDRYTALIQASQGGYEEIAKLLLDRSAKLDSQDKFGCTALIYASLEGHIEIAELLLDRKAKLDLQDYNGMTALMWAVQNRHSEVVKLLLEKGSNSDIKDNLGTTALNYAVDKEIRDLLISNTKINTSKQ